MSELKRAEALYFELNSILSSPHNDTKEEQNEAIELLMRSIFAGQQEEFLKAKMREMVSLGDRGSEYRSKLSNVIRNRYWEKNYIEAIPRRRFVQ